MQTDRRFYVYVHRKLSNGQPFYVGKGTGFRHNATAGRNKQWLDIARESMWRSDIIYQDLPEACSLCIEKILIYASPIKLANLSTGGGRGPTGVKHTEETKAKWRAAKIGRKQSPEHAAKSRIAGLGKKRSQSAVDAIRKRKSRPVISSQGEIFPSVAEAVRLLSLRLGVRCSQGNISMAASGFRRNAHGLSWSYDTSKTPPYQPTTYREKRILCVETGAEFKSVQAAKHWVILWRGSANNQTISQAARRGTSAYGYHWEYIA